ncbi:MAG: hypothetical protein ACTHLW_14335 [Verrucomicrobiota bacterium]
MKHRPPQFELPGTEDAFNLAGESVAPAETQPAVTDLPSVERTLDLFPALQD